MSAAVFRWLRAGVWVLLGTALLAYGGESPFPWFMAAVATTFFARGASYAYLAVRRGAYERDPTPVVVTAARICAAGRIGTVCLCLVSLFRGEGVMSVVAGVLLIAFTTFRLYKARILSRLTQPISAVAPPGRQ